ncbi:MAG: hypothetical protein PVH29_02605 [Candidatus Zixiibacteriota bacterium]|jgi:hypothetical protein
MRNLLVFILVALFACGGLMLVGCKKKEEVPTAETGEVMPETAEAPDTEEMTPTAEETPTAEGTAEEAPTAEGEPGEGE